MGLFGFGKREKTPEGIRVTYYDGELVDFECNHPVQLLLMEDILRITKVMPYVEVRLERSRILSMDILSELEYMRRYRKVSTIVSKEDSISADFYVIHYVDKKGENKHLDFWSTAASTLKMMKMREKLLENKEPKVYDI